MFIIEGKKLQGIYYLSTQNEVFELDLVNKLEHAIIEVDAEKAIQSVDFLINLPELSQKSKNNFRFFLFPLVVNDNPNSHFRETEIIGTFLARHMLYF